MAAIESRYWVFTLNNPSWYDETYAGLFMELKCFKYACWQHEISPTTQTRHLQGFVCLTRGQKRSYITDVLEGRAHLEPKVKDSTLEQCRDYCRKEESRDPAFPEFYQIGEFPELHPGQRTDLIELQQSLRNGLTAKDYCDEYFEIYLRCPNLVQNWTAAQIQERDARVPHECVLIYGPPGTGKSRLASYLAPRGYRHDMGKWFDGYRGERTLIFDDFGGASIPFRAFKRIVDRYPLRVEVKGTSCNLATTQTIITSNYLPEEWWSQEVTGQHVSAIIRRIDYVIWAPSPNEFYQFYSYSDFVQEVLTPRLVVPHAFIQEPQVLQAQKLSPPW
jgi:hypothetical protein